MVILRWMNLTHLYYTTQSKYFLKTQRTHKQCLVQHLSRARRRNGHGAHGVKCTTYIFSHFRCAQARTQHCTVTTQEGAHVMSIVYTEHLVTSLDTATYTWTRARGPKCVPRRNAHKRTQQQMRAMRSIYSNPQSPHGPLECEYIPPATHVHRPAQHSLGGEQELRMGTASSCRGAGIEARHGLSPGGKGARFRRRVDSGLTCGADGAH